MKIAIVHDWLVTSAGAERVLAQLLLLYPQADLFSVVDFLPDGQRGFLLGKQVSTTFIQDLPCSRTKYRQYLPLMPLAIEQIDLSGYDLVLSSSHAVAKGVLTGPDQLHICLCYSPIRYAWDLQHQYLQESGLTKGIKGWLAKLLLHYIRIWDYRTANGVDQFIAISHFIARRIRKVYGRESTVICPPVDVERFSLHEAKDDYYVTASRLVPYKRIDLIVEAFTRMPDKRLVVIGDGPEMAKIKELAGPNIQLLGQQPFELLLHHLQRAKAFVFAAEEDFGIAPLEAQACGTPVIAYGKGGAVETIRGLDAAQPSGVFFYRQDIPALIAAVELFEQHQDAIQAEHCRENALRFSPENFRSQLSALVTHQVEQFTTRR
jgi:glycosyltransferase involved in cell wall biosynthesis